MVKNKWYERSHWTYKVNRGWLIKRGIEAFHWSIFPRGKFLWEISKRFRVDPEVFPKKKKGQKLCEKKKARNIISLTLASFPAMQLPAPPQINEWCIYTTDFSKVKRIYHAGPPSTIEGKIFLYILYMSLDKSKYRFSRHCSTFTINI